MCVVYDVCWVVCDVCGVVLLLLLCCAVLCSFAQAVCYSKREPNIKEYWEKCRSELI